MDSRAKALHVALMKSSQSSLFDCRALRLDACADYELPKNPKICIVAVVLRDIKPCGWSNGADFLPKNFLSHSILYWLVSAIVLYTNCSSDTKVGNLTPEWAERLGLTTNVAVAVGAFDAHMGAVGAEVKTGLWFVLSELQPCDIMVSSYDEMGDKLIPGICGQVDGSVIPNMVGLEAGQSAFGDVYAWFKRLVAWPVENILA